MLSHVFSVTCAPWPPWELLLVGGIFLIERRGHKQPVNPARQVDLTTVLESIPEAAWIVDSNRRIVDANSAAAQLLGHSREQLLDADWSALASTLHWSGDGHDRASVLQRALAGTAVHSERRIATVENREVELLISATPMRDDNGGVVAALIIARDITELTALQRRIGDAERHLAVGQMAAALAHDLNNILTAIGQAAFILETGRGQSEKERRSYVAVIQNAVRRGGEIVARVREYLRTGAGVVELVDVRQLLQEALELLRPLCERAHITVHSTLDDVPPTLGNAADLRRVFTNIIMNAIEAMPQGGEMNIRCGREGERVVASISDTGPGIAPEDRRKIFYPYFTTKKAGTGLGLSGAQRTLRSQGGNISFRTETGRGTTFLITLPIAKSGLATNRGPQQRQPAA